MSLNLNFIASILLPLLPQATKVAGKTVNLRLALAEALSDGELTLDDLVVFVKSWIKAPAAAKPALPPGVNIEKHEVPPIAPPVLPPVTTRLYPSALGINFQPHSAIHEDLPFRVDESNPEYDQLILLPPSTSNMPIHAGGVLSAAYYDDKGELINFEDRDVLYLYETAKWRARVVGSAKEAEPRGIVSIGPGDLAQMETIGLHCANFREAEYERTGGMDVPVHFPPESDELFIQIELEVRTPTGLVSSKPLRMPKVS